MREKFALVARFTEARLLASTKPLHKNCTYMTESQRPPIPPPPAPRFPPMPPPRPTPANDAATGSTQRQPAQTLAGAPGSPRAAVNSAPVPPPSASYSGHRSGAASSMPSSFHFAPPTLEQLVREANDKGISDIHLGIGEVPRFREQGQIIITDYSKTDEETFFGWLREILSDHQIEQFEENLEYDGATLYEGVVRVRINIFVSLNGPAMVLRLIPLKILSMEQLNLPPVFWDLCHYHKGLILITGPTGSGKSTTMAAMIDYINKEMPKHIISIEDPVEFVHQSQKALIKQREVGIHTLKFDNALKAALREDPDIILIGKCAIAIPLTRA